LTVRAWTAEGQTREQLFESRLAEARALSLSHRPGQHFASLASLDEAATLAQSLRLPADRLLDLRNVAVAALVRPDLYPETTWPGYPPGSVAVDFDGRLETYARADREGRCHICRAGTGEELFDLPGPQPASQNKGVCMSPDGRFVAAVYGQGDLLLWRLEQPRPRIVLPLSQVHWVDFRPDGQQVAISHHQGFISVYDLKTCRRLYHLPPDHLRREVTIALHPREPLIAVTSPFGPVAQVRDLRTAKVLAAWPMRSPYHAAWHPSGDKLAIVELGQVHVFNRATFQKEAVWSGGGVRLAFSPEGDAVAARDYGSLIRVFDFATGHSVFTFQTLPLTPMLRFDPTGRRLAGFIKDDNLGIWQLSDGRAYRTFPQDNMVPHGFWGPAAAIDSGGRLLATTFAEGVAFWDLATGTRIGFLPLDRPNRVAFTGGRQKALLTGAEQGCTLRWPVREDSTIPGLYHIGPPEPLPIPSGSWLSHSETGDVLATAARASARTEGWAGIWLWHSGESRPPQQLEPGTDEADLTVSPDGCWLVSSTWNDGPITLWDARTGKRVARLADSGSRPQFSPDGHWLAVPGQSGSLLAVGTWQKVRPLRHPCFFAPDGSTAVESTDEPHVLRLVETVTGRELVRLEEPGLEANGPLAFTPDGSRLIAGCTAQAIRIWDLRALRTELKRRKLDWEMPRYVPATAPTTPLRLQLERGDCDQLWKMLAAQAYDRGIDAAPKLAVRWYCRARYYWAQGQQQKAVRDLAQAVSLAPRAPLLCNDLSWYYQSVPDAARHASEAVALAERAVAGAPGDWGYENTLGMAYYHAGRYRDGIVTLEKSLRGGAGTQDGYDLYGLAMCHAKLGEIKKAHEAVARARAWLEATPGLVPAEVAELRRLRAQAEKVVEQAERAKTDSPTPMSAPARKKH
ncbi:MAG TPA: hypothetical protein VFA18_21380, partial [Gemmataceae bacterium]|nr:hypothetical protein [Gemmataceae bacterium]